MKKIFLVAISLLLTLPAFADYFKFSYEGQTLEYATLGNGECKVSLNDEVEGDVSIPVTVLYKGKELRVTHIGEHAFSYAKSLTSITIPNSVTSIEDCAFAYCQVLTSITIPNSVTSIGEFAFLRCCKLQSVILPNELSSIKRFTFNGCSSLSSVTLGKKLESIGEKTFNDCTNLKRVKCLASKPPFVETDKFGFSPKNCTLYVKPEAFMKYRSANWWREFGSIQPIKNMQTSANADVLKVSGHNGSIALENAPVGSTVIVMDINNATVANEVIKDANETISLNRKGIFIVTIDDATYKVAL